jgi:acetyl-CoA C-acetyltransferase
MRTPIGKTGGCLKYIPVEKLGAEIMRSVIEHSGVNAKAIDKIILANSVGQGGNIARFSGLHAFERRCPPAVTVDYQCGGSLMAVELAAALVKSQMHDLVFAGGAESTSLEPDKYLHEGDPKKPYYPSPLERAPFTPQSLKDQGMLEGAENTASLFGVKRAQLDEIALVSHQRAASEETRAKLKERIISIKESGSKSYEDESIRSKMSMRLLSRMPSLVKPGGLITAGNACLTHDGAAGMLIASEKALDQYSLTPDAEILGVECVSVNPSYSPLGALSAVKKLMKRLDMMVQDVTYFEVNEAFAVKTWSLMHHLKIAHEKLNPLGGTLAYGHPYGATGGVLLTHLTLALAPGEVGIASMGVAGGLGIAVAIKRI